MTAIATITQETIENRIYTIRGKQVMLDRDLAVLYGVETKQLKRQVKRNIDRFPEEFMFELSPDEYNFSRSQNGTLKQGENIKYTPMAFTEVGVVMLSAVLRSTTAVETSIRITRAFVGMRKLLKDNVDVLIRLENVERKQLMLEYDSEKKFVQVFNALESQDLKPKQGIFYDGQIFDAYTFIADLVREAKTSIALIDNYVDDTVLRLFAKRKRGVALTIYTKKDCLLALDVSKFKAQYGPVNVKEFNYSHDRFLILDGTVVYHIGASLKDLGKKWFAFSRMEIAALDLLNKLK